MITVVQTEQFSGWLLGLKDGRARARIVDRIERAAGGNLGDVGPVGEGVSEMRIHYGPGYRVYLALRGKALIVLLCGGDKGSQKRDIRQARQIAKEIDL
jgi:putative addiction module killer protein